MTDDLKALARRARLCRDWHYLPGMLIVDTTGKQQRLTHDDFAWKSAARGVSSAIPDLSDKHTVDGLRELVSRAYGAQIATQPIPSDAKWMLKLPHGNAIGDSVEDVLVQALETANRFHSPA